MSLVDYVLGAVYGISLWLIISGLLELLRRPKTFSFVIGLRDFSLVLNEELSDDLRKIQGRT